MQKQQTLVSLNKHFGSHAGRDSKANWACLENVRYNSSKDKMTNKYSATSIGLIFSISSLVATATFIIPFITVLPLGLTLENVFMSCNENASYSEIGPYILTTMWVIFTVTFLLFYVYSVIKLRQANSVSKKLFILFLITELFIVHPLFFYIDTSQNLDRASDGQFILGITKTFPTSSFTFVIFGALLDILRKIIRPKQARNTISAKG